MDWFEKTYRKPWFEPWRWWEHPTWPEMEIKTLLESDAMIGLESIPILSSPPLVPRWNATINIGVFLGFIRFVSVEIYQPLKWIEKSCSKGALLLRVSVSVTWNSCLWGYQSCQNWLGDFLKWGYPISWMVYKGTSFLEIDDLGVTPWLRKPPFHHIWSMSGLQRFSTFLVTQKTTIEQYPIHCSANGWSGIPTTQIRLECNWQGWSEMVMGQRLLPGWYPKSYPFFMGGYSPSHMVIICFDPSPNIINPGHSDYSLIGWGYIAYWSSTKTVTSDAELSLKGPSCCTSWHLPSGNLT